MSVGALADPGFANDLMNAASEASQHVYLPSGAIAGLDGILAAHEGGLDSVHITTRKSPRALHGAPYVRASGVELMELTEPRLLFEGTAAEAIEGFPMNTNVAVTLGWAVGGMDRVLVTIVADPGTQTTNHSIDVTGLFGSMRIEVVNHPSRNNPSTSALAALSAIATLRKIAAPLTVC
jgi:aspartate dehydrogenase